MRKLRQMMVFMQVVESGSITKAADKLDLSKSVVSQHIKQLEADLAVTLLKRTTRKQSLTAEGERFYLHCCTIHKVSEQAWEEMTEQQTIPRGKLKVTAPHALMDSIVAPALVLAFEQYHDVQLELIGHDDQLDLMQEGIDLAIRFGESTVSNLKQRRIGVIQDVLCCLASRKKEITKMSSLPYVANNWQPKHIEHQFMSINDKKEMVFLADVKHRANTIYTCISLINNGAGVGILPDFVFGKYRDTLTEWLPGYQLAPTPVYVLHPFSGAVPASVKIAIEALSSNFKQSTIALS
ncbi:LysR family transcriptional regulator [Vibrio makurazakiensis]|uniref:LysR family transcriptional regulator n=1 Tax=Vibrio makurazakiensis TaxID=2910250 RepID=UPI003D100E06